MKSRFYLIILLFLTTLASPGAAHPLDEAILEATVDGKEVLVWLRLPKPQLAEFDTNGNGSLDPSEVKEEQIKKVLAGKVEVLGDGQRGQLHVIPGKPGAPNWTHLKLGLRWVFPSKPRIHSFHFDYYIESKDYPRCLASFKKEGKTSSFVFDDTQTDFEFSGRQSTFQDFVFIGAEHILEGHDHILFLVVLLLAGGTLREVVAMVTAFTVAHSITLALAVLGLFTLPGWFVEPVIVLSIAVAALENIRTKEAENRWKVAGVFGLIHGMGFAGLLADMQLSGLSALWPLLGFNIGVELGQALIVVLAFPFLARVFESERGRQFTIVGSTLSALVAVYWFSQILGG